MIPQTPTDTASDAVHDETGVFDHTVLGGYLLEHRIGTGGYGEVWKAIGPGGFAKAVKVLFGNQDSSRADTELQSLQRMRNLRHPFLLSLERVEVEDGRVYVVTELADCSLDDRFKDCRQAGQAGIPRGELLEYLREAADALDFMADHHGLQHLDVKPENLLLQGNHVKVGDFGLTRDISCSDVTAMGGFTPLYTPPEVFEGRPGRRSDQYSLAIVYQVMLTGTSPFSGRTPAQLAAQHLRGRPDLSALSPVERSIVARALEKQSSARFSSCRDFVDALEACKLTGTAAARPSSGSVLPSAEVCRTRVVTPDLLKVASETSRQPSVPIPATVSPPGPRPPRPTVLIGAGGLAGGVLCTMHERLRDNPAAQQLSYLYIDSDRASIAASRRQSNRAVLESDETFLAPLKSAADYRRSPHTEWLSRRWLFNIPRSGQVEGIRPLGRLAFLDHYQPLRERVTRLLKSAAGQARVNSAETDQASDAGQPGPDIIVVAGINGGFGSGAVLDLAYLIQDVLESEQITGCRITGCLLHGTGNLPQHQQMQDASAYACLSEMKYYGTRGLGYDCSSSPTGSIQDESPFDNCYFIHLGESLTSSDFMRTAGNVADYLCASVAGPESAWLQQWRNGEEKSSQTGDSATGQRFRTVGFAGIDEPTMQFAARMCHAVVCRWANDAAANVDRLTDAALQQIDVSLKRMTPSAALLQDHVSNIVQSNVDKLREWLVASLQASGVTQHSSVATLAEILRSDTAAAEKLLEMYDRIAGDLTRQIATRTDDTLNLLDGLFVTRTGAETVSRRVVRQLESFREACAGLEQEARKRLENVLSDSAQKLSAETLESVCLFWGMARMTHALTKHAARLSGLVRQRMQTISVARENRILELRRLFANMGGIQDHGLVDDQLEADDDDVVDEYEDIDDETDHPPTDNGHEQFPDALIDLLSDLVSARAERPVAASLTAGSCDLAASLMMQRSVELVTSALRDNRSDRESGTDQFPANAHPHLSDVGGKHRVLAVTPASLPEKWRTSLVSTFGDCVTECSQASRMSVWCEVEDIAFDAVLRFLERASPQVKNVASRIQTRRDIEWRNVLS